LEKLEQLSHVPIISVKNNYFLQSKNIQHPKEEKEKEKDEKEGEFLPNEVLAEERWELDEEFQQKLEDLSKYKKKKVDGFLYTILFLLKSQKRNSRKLKRKSLVPIKKRKKFLLIYKKFWIILPFIHL
jgi:hypothetical protein